MKPANWIPRQQKINQATKCLIWKCVFWTWCEWRRLARDRRNRSKRCRTLTRSTCTVATMTWFTSTKTCRWPADAAQSDSRAVPPAISIRMQWLSSSQCTNGLIKAKHRNNHCRRHLLVKRTAATVWVAIVCRMAAISSIVHRLSDFRQRLRECLRLPIPHCPTRRCGAPRRMNASARTAIVDKPWSTRPVWLVSIRSAHCAHRASVSIDAISVSSHRAARNATREMMTKSWSIALETLVEVVNAPVPVEPWVATANPYNSGKWFFFIYIFVEHSLRVIIDPNYIDFSTGFILMARLLLYVIFISIKCFINIRLITEISIRQVSGWFVPL